MNYSKKYLAFDFGASNGKVAVGLFDGKKLQLDIIHRFNNNPVVASGTIYWDILYLFSKVKEGIYAANFKYKSLQSLSVDSWARDFGFLDSNGKLISNPVSYRDDDKNLDYRASYFEKISIDKFFSITGCNPIYVCVPLFNLFGMKLKNNPVLKIADKFLIIPDIINYFLSGIAISEYTIANMTMMLNWRTKSWDKEIINCLEINKDIFPEIIATGKIIGNLDIKVAKEIGINQIPVVACASHDTASSIVGIPATTRDKDWAFIVTGTWCGIGIETEEPFIDPKFLNDSFLNQGAAEGKNLFIKNFTGFWILQKCKEKWSTNNFKSLSWDSILEQALKKKSFRAFIDIDDMQFSKNQQDMPEVIRNYCKTTNQYIPVDIGDIARCIYESIVMKFKYDLKTLEDIIGKKIELIYLIGGGIRNKPLCKWTADSTGKVVFAGPAEASLIGNILMQMKADKEINTIEEGREIFKESSEIQYFEPEDYKLWDLAFEKYLKIIK